MKKLDFNALGISELENRELVEINGGEPLSELLFGIFCLVVEAVETFGPAVQKATIDRASGDNYIIWADIGHR